MSQISLIKWQQKALAGIQTLSGEFETVLKQLQYATNLLRTK